MEEMEKENLPVVVKDGKEGELGPATIWMSLEHIFTEMNQREKDNVT